MTTTQSHAPPAVLHTSACRRRLLPPGPGRALNKPLPSPPRCPQGVCPGDVLMSLPETGVLRIGGGVQQDGEQLVATKAGLLQQARNGKLWVEARQKR